MKTRIKPPKKVWADFKECEGLTDKQLTMFKRYEELLSQINQSINLTSITDLSSIVRQHFVDSISLRAFTDIKNMKVISDIGTGAGFPAIPIKIIFPHVKLVLIEVTKKKQRFLADLVNLLGLQGVEICDLDWRTFLRKTDYEVDLFVTRAAIGEQELVRMFKPSCRYRDIQIAYWVSELWECNSRMKEFVQREVFYRLGAKRRKLVFLGR
jgi:16S rRNA (guanine527-N7)-methyltransferase